MFRLQPMPLKALSDILNGFFDRRNMYVVVSWRTYVWTRPCVTATPPAWTCSGPELPW